MKPATLLLLFCGSTLLLFGDRGVISCNSVNGRPAGAEHPGYGIQGEFDLSLTADGLLAAMLVLGLMLSAPTCSQLSRRIQPLRLMGVGLSMWIAGAAGCAMAPSFPFLLACRFIVGAACGPYIAVAAPIIDDQAPRDRKSFWLAVLFCCVPTGYAFGFCYGGLVGTALGWRAAFAIEAAAMLPFAAMILLAAPVHLRSSSKPTPPDAAPGGRHGSNSNFSKALAALWADCRGLCASPVCLLAILALSVYTAALGCYSFFGPKAARTIFELPPETADLLFGGVTVLTGVLGTLCGGLALDALGPSVRNALLLCTAGVGAGFVLLMVGFAAAKSLACFGLLFGGGELAMFSIAAPANAVLLWSVPPELRSFALAAAEFSQHLLGDIPSPPALGWLQSKLGDWRLSMCICTGLLAISAALFGLAFCQSGNAVSYREVLEVEGEQLLEDEVNAAGRGGGAIEAAAELEQPLLQDA